MPSSVIAQVLEITNLRPHEGADRLELATLGGWQIVCGRGLYEEGERVVYITPDSLITENLADILEIRQHLSSVKNPDGTFVTNDKGETMLRVRQAKLRGEPSFGTTIPSDVMLEEYGIDLASVDLGTNLTEEIGIKKYEPQMIASSGDADVDHPLFPKYTSVENLRNFPNVLEEGEPVSVSIKIHGCLKEDSLVTMADGSEKEIQHIKQGDEVKSYDYDTKKFVNKKVLGVKIQEITYYLDWYVLDFGVRKLTCTEDHPILTRNRGWVLARDLTYYDDVVDFT